MLACLFSCFPSPIALILHIQYLEDSGDSVKRPKVHNVDSDDDVAAVLIPGLYAL